MTIPFGPNSIALLSKAHPDLQVLFNEVNKYIQCTILTSSRTLDEEKVLVSKGLSKTLKSKHLVFPDGYCHAVDVAPDPVNFERKNFNLDEIYFAGFVMAMAIQLYNQGKIKSKIRYGGDWNRNDEVGDESFIDLDHFEIDE